jgi:hypothetical protein
MSETPREAPRTSTAAAADAILGDARLSRAEKIRRLVDLARDARALETATGEGMTGPASGLNRVHRALRELGAEGAIEGDAV